MKLEEPKLWEIPKLVLSSKCLPRKRKSIRNINIWLNLNLKIYLLLNTFFSIKIEFRKMKDRSINLSISKTSELLIPNFPIRRSFRRWFYILIFFLKKSKGLKDNNNNNNNNKRDFHLLKNKKIGIFTSFSFMQFLIFSPLLFQSRKVN